MHMINDKGEAVYFNPICVKIQFVRFVRFVCAIL